MVKVSVFTVSMVMMSVSFPESGSKRAEASLSVQPNLSLKSRKHEGQIQ